MWSTFGSWASENLHRAAAELLDFPTLRLLGALPPGMMALVAALQERDDVNIEYGHHGFSSGFQVSGHESEDHKETRPIVSDTFPFVSVLSKLAHVTAGHHVGYKTWPMTSGPVGPSLRMMEK